MQSARAKTIVSNQKILGCKPILSGTRFSVEFVLELFQSGMGFDEILSEYPTLTAADLRAVLHSINLAV